MTTDELERVRKELWEQIVGLKELENLKKLKLACRLIHNLERDKVDGSVIVVIKKGIASHAKTEASYQE